MAAIHEAEGRVDEASRSRVRAEAEAAEYERESRRSRTSLLAFYERVARAETIAPEPRENRAEP